MEVPAFPPSSVCIACDGCCRYADVASVWAPLFLFEEIRSLTESNVVPSCVFTHASAREGGAARIDVVSDGEGFVCPCLGADRHACTIYGHRPFECRLYPFLLTTDKGRRILALDEHCPYVVQAAETGVLRHHEKALQSAFASGEGRAFLGSHPELFQEYPVPLKAVFDL